jgi:hypothetical protein
MTLLRHDSPRQTFRAGRRFRKKRRDIRAFSWAVG